jgi:mono/diheme cytochrome c family protein
MMSHMLAPLVRRFQPSLRPLLSAAAVLLLLGAMSELRAQDFNPETDIPLNKLESKVPDIANGKALTEKLCVSCHAVDGPSPSGHSDIPSFKAAANKEGQTQETLTSWLIAPHPPMPNLSLSREEIRDIGGYVLSLRDAR